MEQPINLASLARHFSDEEAAWELVERMRWPVGPVCPHCGGDRAYFLKARSGQRTTKKGTVSYRRLWKCAGCRKQFSVLVGSIFEDTKIPLSKWLLAVYMMCADKNGTAAYELHRTLGITNKSAWFMCHRIREAMANGGVLEPMEGVIVADETFIGGSEENKHVGTRSSGGGSAGKTVVLTLINTHSGESRSRVIPDVTSATLEKALAEQVRMNFSTLYTDEARGYKRVGQQFLAHETVNHSQDEYVRRLPGRVVTTNRAENFFSQLKRSIDGTHHHVSREHLSRYLSEFDYRYTSRKMSDSQRMADLMGRTGGVRLTYRQIV